MAIVCGGVGELIPDSASAFRIGSDRASKTCRDRLVHHRRNRARLYALKKIGGHGLRPWIVRLEDSGGAVLLLNRDDG